MVTVLVIDDDPPIRRMLERTFAAEGYRVEAASDGGEALAAVERSVPDLVVLDVAMPGVDGLAVTRRLRAKGLAVPILLLTARDAVADRVAGLDAGADDYLVKPFATDELLARVRALLRRGRAPQQLSASAPALLTAPGALDAPLAGTQQLVEVLDRRGRIVDRSLSLGGRVVPAGRLVRRTIATGRGGYADGSLGGERIRLYVGPLA